MSALIVVRATWDPEAEVWWTESSDLLVPWIGNGCGNQDRELRGHDAVIELPRRLLVGSAARRSTFRAAPVSRR